MEEKIRKGGREKGERREMGEKLEREREKRKMREREREKRERERDRENGGGGERCGLIEMSGEKEGGIEKKS